MAHFMTFYFFNFCYGCACVWVCAGDSSACKDRSISSLDMDMGSCEPPEGVLVSIERRSRDLRSSPPTLTDFPPSSFSPFLPLAHMSTCPALCCMLRKTRKQIPFPPVAIPLNLVLSGATPLLSRWLQSISLLLDLFRVDTPSTATTAWAPLVSSSCCG